MEAKKKSLADPELCLWRNIHDLSRGQLAMVARINHRNHFEPESRELLPVDFLHLPAPFQIQETAAADVGTWKAFRCFSVEMLAQIYVMNKEIAPAGIDPMRFAFLRVEGVRHGWLVPQKQTKVIFRTPRMETELAVKIFKADVNYRPADVNVARQAALVIPLIAEAAFRILGRYYNSEQTHEFDTLYQYYLATCGKSELAQFLPLKDLYRTALQWISPSRAWDVLVAQKETNDSAKAIYVHADSPHLRQQFIIEASILLHGSSREHLQEYLDAQGFNSGLVHSMAKEISANPRLYHKSSKAYGLAGPTVLQMARLSEARRMALNLFIISSGNFDTYGKKPEQPGQQTHSPPVTVHTTSTTTPKSPQKPQAPPTTSLPTISEEEEEEKEEEEKEEEKEKKEKEEKEEKEEK